MYYTENADDLLEITQRLETTLKANDSFNYCCKATSSWESHLDLFTLVLRIVLELFLNEPTLYQKLQSTINSYGQGGDNLRQFHCAEFLTSAPCIMIPL